MNHTVVSGAASVCVRGCWEWLLLVRISCRWVMGWLPIVYGRRSFCTASIRIPTCKHFCRRQYWHLSNKQSRFWVWEKIFSTDFAWIYWLDSLWYWDRCRALAFEYSVWKTLYNPKCNDRATCIAWRLVQYSLHTRGHRNGDLKLDLGKRNTVVMYFHCWSKRCHHLRLNANGTHSRWSGLVEVIENLLWKRKMRNWTEHVPSSSQCADELERLRRLFAAVVNELCWSNADLDEASRQHIESPSACLERWLFSS